MCPGEVPLISAFYDTGFGGKTPFSACQNFRQLQAPRDSFFTTASLPGNPKNGLASDTSKYGGYQIRAWAYVGTPPKLIFGKVDSVNYQPSIKTQATRSDDTVFLNVRIDPRAALFLSSTDSVYGECDSLNRSTNKPDKVGYGPLTKPGSSGGLFWTSAFIVNRAARCSCSASATILTSAGKTPVTSLPVTVPASSP